MNRRKVFSILPILFLVTLMLGLAAVLLNLELVKEHGAVQAYSSLAQNVPFSTRGSILPPEATAAITGGGNSNPSTTSLTATNSIADINNYVVALVIQPGQNQLHAYNALTGEWATLGGSDVKVRPSDIAIVSKLLILVAQPGQDQLHAYSALTGEWATLAGSDVKVSPDDTIKVNDSVIVIAQPGQNQLHAYSALTGEWATLAGSDVRVSPDDKILVGTEE